MRSGRVYYLSQTAVNTRMLPGPGVFVSCALECLPDETFRNHEQHPHMHVHGRTHTDQGGGHSWTRLDRSTGLHYMNQGDVTRWTHIIASRAKNSCVFAVGYHGLHSQGSIRVIRPKPVQDAARCDKEPFYRSHQHRYTTYLHAHTCTCTCSCTCSPSSPRTRTHREDIMVSFVRAEIRRG